MNTYRVTWHADGQPWVETVHAPNRRDAMWHVIRGLRDLFAREGGPEISPRTVRVRRLEETSADG